MKKFWNYLFFATWKTLCSISIHYIEKPIDYIFNLIPYYRNLKNKSETDKYSKEIMHNQKIGANISLAFYLFLMTTTFFVFMTEFWISLLFFSWIDFKSESTFNLFLLISFTISCLINYYLLSWNNSGYIKYFNTFEEKRNKKLERISFILLHLGNLVYFAFSVYYLITYE